jgi:hypothetical protein
MSVGGRGPTSSKHLILRLRAGGRIVSLTPTPYRGDQTNRQKESDRVMQTSPILTRHTAKLAALGDRTHSTSTTTVVVGVLLCQAAFIACYSKDARRFREPLGWSAWVEDAAVQRGYIKPGDFAQFGCPPGWMGIEETAAALRGREVSTTYMGADPPSHEGTITCVSQKEFALPSQSTSTHPRPDQGRRLLAPVWVSTRGDGITIGFSRELPSSAAVYIGQDTPCGPRLIGIELGDLLKWLADPSWGPKRHFLGMISGGCPEQNRQ